MPATERSGFLAVTTWLTLYLISFALPFEHGLGWAAFWWGLLYCWYVPVTFAWWANPLFWLALWLAGDQQWKAAAVVGTTAAALAFGFWLLFRTPDAAQTLWAYWAWFGSMAGFALHATVMACVSRHQKP